MDRRGAARLVSIWWAVVGAAIAFASLPEVNNDARLLVGTASVAGPAAALAASGALARRRDHRAGALLIASALATPTYYAYVLNVIPLIVGIVVWVSPRLLGPATGHEHVAS